MADYYGRYARFDTPSKKDAAVLLNADNAVGDVYDIEFEMKDGSYKAWLLSGFGERIGFFDSDVSRCLKLAEADGLVEKAILSFVAFTSHPGEGHYWGEAAIVCFKPAYDSSFQSFVSGLAKRIGDGVRPNVDFDREAVEKIVESNGTWMPTQTIPLPETDKGMAIIKRRKSITDKLIEKGRTRNKGCFIASWIVLLAIVALIVFGLKSCFGW